MPTIDEMDEYVNWDNAAAATASGIFGNQAGGGPSTGTSSPFNNTEVSSRDYDLVLENVNEDDFGFFALQHFTGESSDALVAQPPMDPTATTMGPLEASSSSAAVVDMYEAPEVPCTQCALGGYLCKLIPEGAHKGFCTSCVAFGWACSFASAPGTMSGMPNPILSMPAASWMMPEPQQETLTLDDADMDLLRSLRQNHASSTGLAVLSDEQRQQSLQQQQQHHHHQPHHQHQPQQQQQLGPPAKIGARFSRESVRILKGWLSTHSRHPYPSEDEKDMLVRQTGLTKTQITNWLANYRRRNKMQPPRSTSPHYRSWSGPAPMDIPKRRGTPALEKMNPLQRWVDSPPEHEPASPKDIARAITSSSSQTSSGLDSPFSYNYTDDGSGRSLFNGSSASSLGTSHSSGSSFASGYSHHSKASFKSVLSALSHGSRERRRRRKNVRKRATAEERTPGLGAPLKTFQCTFCTETFRTKHDWQRHEKSLHLSLERWVCALEGPRGINPETNQICCTFCGEANPSDAHVEAHNFSTCQEKSIGERTFYRKDHLNQHLKLVHTVKFVDWAMRSWRISTPEIRSRCGFCGIILDTWSTRVDHLAEHFKTGCSMADWRGDWGFEPPVLKMVENSIPPYRIHDERGTPFPYVAGQSPPESPRSAWELIKLEMEYFRANHLDQAGTLPSDEEMKVEACRIIFASEVLSLQGIASTVSWLRDLLMSDERITQQARFGPLRGQAENRLSSLKINGKDNLFEACSLESQLREFVKARLLLGLTPLDRELQQEACYIVGRIEEVSTMPSEAIANWLVRLILRSTDWLANFRNRAHLPRSEDMGDEHHRSTDPSTIDSTIYNYSRLERELKEYVDAQRAVGVEPNDDDLQRRARIVIYEYDDGWNQTAADNAEWLAAFKRRHPPAGAAARDAGTAGSTASGADSAGATASSGLTTLGRTESSGTSAAANCPVGLGCVQEGKGTAEESPRTLEQPGYAPVGHCYRRLARELRKWAVTTMSPNNPARHVPTDQELQFQARMIIYDDDDPWNQTAADSEEWLRSFKLDVGITTESGAEEQVEEGRGEEGKEGEEEKGKEKGTGAGVQLEGEDEGGVDLMDLAGVGELDFMTFGMDDVVEREVMEVLGKLDGGD